MTLYPAIDAWFGGHPDDADRATQAQVLADLLAADPAARVAYLAQARLHAGMHLAAPTLRAAPRMLRFPLGTGVAVAAAAALALTTAAWWSTEASAPAPTRSITVAISGAADPGAVAIQSSRDVATSVDDGAVRVAGIDPRAATAIRWTALIQR
jgi:hypothetical protein